MFGAVRVLFAAEDHGAGTQHVRFRISPRYSRAATSVALALLALAIAAAVEQAWIAAVMLGGISAAFLSRGVVECAVASAAARRCVASIDKSEEGAVDAVFTQLAVTRAGAGLRRPAPR
jgi:hypothetical protein